MRNRGLTKFWIFFSALFLAKTTLVVPATAVELFGVCLFGQCETAVSDKEKFIDPRRYRLEFSVNEDAPDRVQDAVKGASQLWVGKDNAVGGSAGLIARAKGDYRRILAALYDHGFYAGTISIVLNGSQAANLPPFVELPKTSDVSVSITTGPLYRFGKAEILNRAPLVIEPDDVVGDLSETGFFSGAKARAFAVRKAENLAVEEWQQLGFAKAKVANKSATALHDAKLLDVQIQMEPGRKARYGALTVEGAEHMDPDFIAYMTGLNPGDEYDPDDLERAIKRLERLGVFASRKIEEAEFVSADGLLPLNVLVRERKRRRIGVGATLSSLDGAGAQGYWLHRNLFGRAESIRFDASVGGVGATVDPDEFDYFLGATYTTPGVYSPDTDMIANVYAKQEFNETFKEQSAGGSLLFKNYWSDQLTFVGGVLANYGDYTDTFGKRTFFTTGLTAGAVYDGRDNKLEPTEGYYFSIDASPFYEWEFGNTAARLQVEARTYLDFDTKGKTVVAGRVKLGSLVGPSLNRVPPDMLFTAGGGNSVRGYSFKSIGIRQPNGDISGGASLLETSLELRRRFSEAFGGVAFLDAGFVGKQSFADYSNTVKIGAGLGIRYYTSLGPIRLDVAFPLSPEADDAGFAVYAGIGQAF